MDFIEFNLDQLLTNRDICTYTEPQMKGQAVTRATELTPASSTFGPLPHSPDYSFNTAHISAGDTAAQAHAHPV